jgi:hypothetical protein
MNKTITVLRKSDSGNSAYVPGSMSERIAMVWPLTQEVVSLGTQYDIEQPFQKHITRLINRKEYHEP